ncbi:MAG: gliding motility-associated C-terminal domain-containing protein [Bacteroidota bacterium]
MKSLVFLCLLLLPLFLQGQNLIPNGSFETITGCPSSPDKGVLHTRPWYITNETPDVFYKTCPNHFSDHPFWHQKYQPFEGNAFLGLGGILAFNGMIASEGVGVKLLEPLEAGRAYFFQMQIRNKGLDHFDLTQLRNCDTSPRKQIGIYFSEDSAQVIVRRELVNGAYLTVEAYSPNRLVMADSSRDIFLGQVRDWHTYSNCFIAEGGEQHMGLVGTLGQHNALLPCVNLDSVGAFHWFYHDIDAVQLLEIPEELTIDTLTCLNRGWQASVKDLVPFPIFEEANIRWEDGKTDERRIFWEAGTYTVYLELPCVTVPFHIRIRKQEDCNSYLHMATAFSPNEDGINDRIGPVLSSSWEIGDFEIQIIDRWGRTVFTSSDPSESWNGRYLGRMSPEGTYHWQIFYSVRNEPLNQRFFERGWLTLFR